MVTEGYPDWSRVYSQTATEIVSEESDFSVLPTYTYGPFYVGAFPMVRFIARYAGGPPGPIIEATSFEFHWSEIPAGPSGNTVFTYYSDNNTQIIDAIGVMTPWLFIVTNDLAAVPVNQWILILYGLVSCDDTLRPAVTKEVMTKYNTSIGAHTGDAFYSDTITTGPAEVSATMDGPNWQVSFYSIIDGNIQYLLAQLNFPTLANTVPFAINLPPTSIYVNVQNNDAVARHFNLAILIP